MTKSEFSEMALIDFLHYLLSEDKAKESFKATTGFDLNALCGRSPIVEMIDRATEYEQDIMYNFIVWAAENFWDEQTEIDQIKTYRDAKDYLTKKKTENDQ